MVDLAKLHSLNGNYPTWLPNRIRLSDGSTKTNRELFTQEDLDSAGWKQVEFPPEIESNLKSHVYTIDEPYAHTPQKIIWNGIDWEIVDRDQQEYQEEWDRVRKHRDKLLEEFEWKIYRYESEVRQGITPTDDISEIDTYVQALRNVPQQDVESPWHVVWPAAPTQEGPAASDEP